MKSEKTRLAIFDTFKTKRQQITGEAARQRAIIHHLSNVTNSASKTRTAISQSIAEENQSEILDYEKATEVINTASACAVGTCYCRHKMEHKGEACDKPQDVCLTFNNAAKTLIKHGIAKELTKEETHKKLQECIDLGLVQVGDNTKQGVGWICNCCGCCCEAVLAYKRLKYHKKINSNWYAKVNNKCTGCTLCEKKCPVTFYQVWHFYLQYL